MTELTEFQQRVINAADKDTPLIVYAPKARGKTFLYNHLCNNGWTQDFDGTVGVVYDLPANAGRQIFETINANKGHIPIIVLCQGVAYPELTATWNTIRFS